MTVDNRPPNFGSPANQPAQPAQPAQPLSGDDQTRQDILESLVGPVTPATSASPASQGPNFSDVYVDPREPTEMGAPPVFQSIVMPNLYKGFIEGATFLFDIPTLGMNYLLRKGAEAVGSDAFQGKPVTLGDLGRAAFEAPATIETAITGKPPTITSGFSTTPRAPRSDTERAARDWAYVTGGVLSFPATLGSRFVYGTFNAPVAELDPVKRLLNDAAGRNLQSNEATGTIRKALANTKDAASALNAAAKDYAVTFTRGLGTTPVRTLSKELAIGTAAGAGYAGPEFFNDENQQITLDLGEGEVDIKPTLKLLSSLGLPIAIAHTPTAITLAGDKTKAIPLLKWVWDRARVFGKSAVAGFTEKGQQDMASRILVEMSADPNFLLNKFLPAVESGLFASPGKSSAIRYLDDGTIIPAEGGLRPDTLQALKQLGVDDTRLAQLDNILKGRESNLQGRVAEEVRRANTIDEMFDTLRTRIKPGEEAETYAVVEKARARLEEDSLSSVEQAAHKADEVYKLLEPAIGREQASEIAVDILRAAESRSKAISGQLWSKENIGTDQVNATSLGDWALGRIQELGPSARLRQGVGFLYKLAGKERLNSIGIGKSGERLTPKDLENVSDIDAPLTPESVSEKGILDVFGEPGTLYASPTTVPDVQRVRSQLSSNARAARRAGNDQLARDLEDAIEHIDDAVLVNEKLIYGEGTTPSPENLRNLEIARGYTFDQKNNRFGPQTIIGKILRNPLSIDEGFLSTLMKTGPTTGKRVEMWRDAINEPQRPADGTTTWTRDPDAALTVGDNPNVIEAELLRRFTERVPYGKVTERSVANFIRDYKEAIEKVPGLMDKLSDAATAQAGVDAMTDKIVVPSRERILAGIKAGATAEDIARARRLQNADLTDTRLRNTASSYLDADVDAAALNFINKVKSNPAEAKKLADNLANLLRTDETGAAEAGFRAALWRGLRETSRRTGPDGEPAPGINTAALRETTDQMQPLLDQFFTKDQIAFLDELTKGGSLQRTGTTVDPAQFAEAELTATRQAFGQQEAVALAGRTMGQKFFGWFGINPLVATGQGRRIAAYTFKALGEDKIYKIVEDALRDPERAAALMRRYKEIGPLAPPEKATRIAEEVLDDPSGAAKAVGGAGANKLKETAKALGEYLSDYSSDAIRRVVRLGLLPAQAESRKLDVEEDWQLGPPYVYQENRVRQGIEENQGLQIDIPAPPPNIGPVTEAAPEAPPRRQMAALPMRPPSRDSALSQVSPVQPLNTAQRGLQIFGANDPVFKDVQDVQTAKDGGIMSVNCKPRQMVG